MSNGRERSRAWCFTSFAEDFGPFGMEEVIEGARYYIVGREVCPSTGRVHYQGFVYFENARRFGSVRAALGDCHIERARGSVDDNIAYCSKDGEFREFGTRPVSNDCKGSKEQQRWSLAKQSALEGKWEDVPADIFIKHYGNIRRIHADFFVGGLVDLPNTCGVWVYGKSGFGKSTMVREICKEFYPKMCNKWWDAYDDEDNVIMDDMDKRHIMLGHHLKIWSDRYVFIAEVKGRSRRMRPKKFIVTSQYSINDIFGIEPETQEALRRRFYEFEIEAKYQVPIGLNVALTL